MRLNLSAPFLIVSLILVDVAAADRPTLRLDDSVREKSLLVLRQGLRSEEFWPSIHAAEALTLAGCGEETIEFLTPKLPGETDDQRRCGLARELVRAGDWQKAAVMLEILSGDDPYGHVHAAESLYKVGEIGDGAAMRRALAQSGENVKLRLMAAAALGRCGNPAAMKLLRKTLAADDADAARIAAWILARIGDPSDAPQLRKLAANAEDELSRCYFENALASLGDEQGMKSFERNLSSTDPAVVTYAATFAGDARALSAADRLIELLDHENVDVRVRAAQSLLVMAQPASPAERPIPAGWRPAPKEEISTLVYPAEEKYPRCTEGSIVRLRDDSLLYAVTRFAGGGGDFDRASIVGRQSYDGGRTWGETRALQETTGKLNVMSVTLRRLQAPRDNIVAMFYLQKNGFDDLRVYVRHSTDEAKTFGEPILVTTERGYHVMNNDRVTQLSSGRLLAPVATTSDVRKVNHFKSLCWLSDDGGRTWRKGKEAVDLPQRGAMEPEVIELKDGRVMMIVRTQLGHIAASYSKDGGDTWTEPSPLSDLQAPEAPATLRRVPSTGDLVLIWNNTYVAGAGHGGRRTPLTAAISSDEGRTWGRLHNLESNGDRTYSYPSLTFVKDHAVLSYWEGHGGRLSNRFRSLPVSWFYRN